MEPLVSIITPSYNQSPFLEATLQSVLRQDYPNLEYLVVDGDSSDGSQEIIQRYVDQLAWWVSEPDQGQADAINKGCKHASGEIIAWLNSDDLYLPGAVGQAVAAFANHPQVGVVYGDAISIDGKGRLLNELCFDNWGIEDFLQFKIICQPAVFMRRSALDEIGYLDISYQFFLDHHLWIRLARKYEFLHVPAFWAVSRYHPEAKNVKLAAESGHEVYRILEWAAGQPDLAQIISRDYRKVWSGAHAIIGRYQLDGGKPKQALYNYSKAAQYWPPSLKSFWHRYLFAALSLLGMGFLAKWYYSLKERNRPRLAADQSLEGWPGIKTG